MRTDEVVKYFGSQAAVARALNIKPPSVADWGEFVPPLRQLQIEALTDGKLRADTSILPGAQTSPQQAA
jgi:transcriptional repressor of cell division inhibition gene dicB